MASVMEQLSEFGKGRRHPNDPFFAAGDEVCKAMIRQGVFDIDDEELCHEIVSTFTCHVPGCAAEFGSLLAFETHYNGRHRFPCVECKKQLPSAHLLDLHLTETHDSFFQVQAERKPMYQCYVEECGRRFPNPQERRSHCIMDHKFPHDFRFDSTSTAHKKQQQHQKKKGGGKGIAMETDAVPPPRQSPKPFSRRGGGRMWHGQKTALQGTHMDVETMVKDLRDSLPQ